MGRIITTDTKLIRPCQSEIRKGSLQFNLGYYLAHGRLIAPPVVKISGDFFLTMDGHHGLTVLDALGSQAKVYVAEHQDDFLDQNNYPGSEEAIIVRNHFIRVAFNLIEDVAEAAANNNIRSYEDLRNTLGLRGLKEMKRYCGMRSANV